MARVNAGARRGESPAERRAREAREAAVAAAAEGGAARRGEDDDQAPAVAYAALGQPAHTAVPHQVQEPARSLAVADPPPAPVAVLPGEVDLPSADAPPQQIVAECERIILAARVEREEAQKKLDAAWMSRIGPAVRLVHATRAYKTLTDPQGKPYRSFARWAQERCGISRPHAYRMVSEGPVVEALAPLGPGPLATRQVDVLAPVLRQHGPDAVRGLWSTAAAAGGTGHVQLAITRDQLGLAVQPEDDEPARELPGDAAAGALVRVQKAAVLDREMLRQAVRQDPDGARRALEAARRFAEELDAVLGELDPPAAP
jgi:hypothetical protein